MPRSAAVVPPPPPIAARRSERPAPPRSGPVPKAVAGPRLPKPPPVPGSIRRDATPSGVRLRVASPTASPGRAKPSTPPPVPAKKSASPPPSKARLGRSAPPPPPRMSLVAPPRGVLPERPRFAPPPPAPSALAEEPDDDTLVEGLEDDAFAAAWMAAARQPSTPPPAPMTDLERAQIRVHGSIAELGEWTERRAEDALERCDAALRHAADHRSARPLYAIGAAASLRAGLFMAALAFVLGALAAAPAAPTEGPKQPSKVAIATVQVQAPPLDALVPRGR